MKHRTGALRMGLVALGVFAAAVPAAAQERPIDRWLLSRPFSAGSLPDAGPLPTVAELNPLFAPGDVAPPAPSQLEEDMARADSLLGRPPPPGLDEPMERRPPSRGSTGGASLPGLRPGWMVRRDSVLFPDRGIRVGATVWTLVRQDGDPRFELDSLLRQQGATATFAHVYVRSPADRTVRLVVAGLGCSVVSARLNERPLPFETTGAGPVDPVCAAGPTSAETMARLAYGWNALLLEIEGDEAPYGFSAILAPGPGGEPLDDLRIQASRPPGIQPNLPLAAIDVVDVRVPGLQWRGGDLSAEVVVDFRLWGGRPPPNAEARIEIGSERAEHRFGQRPAGGGAEMVESVFELVPLKKAREVALGNGVEVRLEWKDHEEEIVRHLPTEAILLAFHGPIQLQGWTGGGTRPGSGDVLTGEWKVPGWLSGFTVELVTQGAPAEYLVDGQPPTRDGERVILCADCRKNARLGIRAAVSGEWSALPSVRLVGPSYADAAAEGSPSAERWLRALTEGGSEGYRKLLADYASGGP